MIAPDEVAPARRELIQASAPGKAELGGDFGRRIRAIGRSFVPQDRRLPSRPAPPARPSTPRPGRNAPLRRNPARAQIRGCRGRAALRLALDSSSFRARSLPPRFVEGALKRRRFGGRTSSRGSGRTAQPVRRASSRDRPRGRWRVVVLRRRRRRDFFPGPSPHKGVGRPAAGDRRPTRPRSASQRRTTPSPCPRVRRSARPSTASVSRIRRIRSTALTASTRRAPGNISANSSPPNRATLSCPRTFCTRILANRRNRRSPTRWPNRSLTCLNRSMSARARQKLSPALSRLLHFLREAGVKEAAIADRGHHVAQSGLFGPLEVRLQLHDLEAQFFELVSDVCKACRACRDCRR